MKILVTGMTGFIGSQLEQFISPTDDIYAVVRTLPPVSLNRPNIQWVQGDLNDPVDLIDKLKAIRPEACIHLAWEGIPDFGYGMCQKNLVQGAALIRGLIEECGCRKIIVAGTEQEYGKVVGPCQEDDSTFNKNYFTWAKRSLCDLGMMLALKHQITFIWMRVFFVYGPGHRKGSLIPMVTSALRQGERPNIKTPTNENDFFYVKDSAEAFVMALKENIPTGIYNLGGGQAIPIWKVCEKLEMALGQKPVRAMELKNMNVPSTANYWADTSKAASILGWKAKTSLEEGIKHYLASLEPA